MLIKASLGDFKILKQTSESNLLSALKKVESQENNPLYKITDEKVKEIFNNIKKIEVKIE